MPAGSDPAARPGGFAEVDWSRWEPTERAVLCFVRDGDRVLLIHKKTGLGAGKVNAPGGRIDPGETAEEAAIRVAGKADPVIEVILARLAAAEFVDLADASTREGVSYMVSTGLLTQARADAILGG